MDRPFGRPSARNVESAAVASQLDAPLKWRFSRVNGLGGRSQTIAVVANGARAEMRAAVAILCEIASTLIKVSLKIQPSILQRHTVPPTFAHSPFIKGMVLRRISQARIRDIQSVVWPSRVTLACGRLVAARHLSLRALNDAGVIKTPD